MTIGGVVGLVYVLNFLILIVLICFERRDPVVSLAWLLAFTAIPVVGFLVFLIFGKGLKRKTAKKYAQKWRMNIDLSEKLSLEREKETIKNDKSFAHTDIAAYLLSTNNSVLTDDNNIKIFTSAHDKFDQLFIDIDNARDSINLLYFIIKNDDIGNKLISRLAKKAKEGIEVRLLYDSLGSFFTPHTVFNPLVEAGGKVSQFFPVQLGSYSKINHRNHRKIVVIDGKIGYIGGINVGDEYFGLKRPSPWRDTHIRVTGSAVRYLQKAFSLDWLFSTNEDLSTDIARFFPAAIKREGNKRVQIVCSGPDSSEEEVKCGMIKMINNARHFVYLQSPYFVPDQSFINSLKIASRSGIDVRVMIPGIPDKNYVFYSSMSYVGELLEQGIRVFMYPGFLHAKMCVSDYDMSTIGTTNIDIRSFQLHFEINAFIYDCDIASECRSIFLNDQSICHEITLAEYKKRGFKKEVLEGFFRLFSPIM